MPYIDNKITRDIFSIFTVLFLSLFAYTTTIAATFYTSPGSSSYQVGDVFVVKVLVNSGGDTMNAYSANISYPTSILEAVSVSEGSSIVDFWSIDPTINSGSISFEGVTLNGYSGNIGEVVNITFRAIAPGVATVGFNSAEILANDGFGTSVISGQTGSNFEITQIVIEETEEETEEVEDSSFNILSSTHPDEDKWYSDNNPSFSWNLPEGVIDVDYVYSTSEEPEYDEDSSRGVIDGVDLSNVPDGVNYLHVIFRTEDGWGDTYTYKFNIDTESPKDLEVEVVNSMLSVSAIDDGSGILNYEISINGEYATNWDGEGEYSLGKLKTGNNTISVIAQDYAGNMVDKSTTVFVPGKTIDQEVVYILLLLILLLVLIIIILLVKYHRLSKDYFILIAKRRKKEDERSLKAREKSLKVQLNKTNSLNKSVVQLENKIKKEIKDISKSLEKNKNITKPKPKKKTAPKRKVKVDKK